MQIQCLRQPCCLRRVFSIFKAVLLPPKRFCGYQPQPFAVETFTTLLAEYFTTFNVCILPKCEGQNWEGHNWCHTTVWPENKVADGGPSLRKPWTSCIQAAPESEAAHLDSTVSAKKQRPTAVHSQHNTARRRTADLCMGLFTHYRDTTRGAGPMHPAPCSAVQHRKASPCSRSLYLSTGSTENTQVWKYVQNLNF